MDGRSPTQGLNVAEAAARLHLEAQRACLLVGGEGAGHDAHELAFRSQVDLAQQRAGHGVQQVDVARPEPVPGAVGIGQRPERAELRAIARCLGDRGRGRRGCWWRWRDDGGQGGGAERRLGDRRRQGGRLEGSARPQGLAPSRPAGRRSGRGSRSGEAASGPPCRRIPGSGRNPRAGRRPPRRPTSWPCGGLAGTPPPSGGVAAIVPMDGPARRRSDYPQRGLAVQAPPCSGSPSASGTGYRCR